MSGGEGFDLRELVREVAATSLIADPGLLAKEVLGRITPEDVSAALEEALPTFVYHAAARGRVVLADPSGQAGHDAQRGSAAGVAPSRKVAAIREAWRAQLRDRISVGTGEWKFLGECTAADLAHAAQVREALARANAERAEWLHRLAALLTEYGVEHVRDLPDEVLASALGRAA